MTDSPNVITVRGLTARYGTSQILHGVDVDVSRGKTTVIVGRNGVGKTTLLRTILGYVEAQGEVEFNGASLMEMPTHERVQQGMAYVPENRDVFQGLSVAENLRLAERPGQEARYDLIYNLFSDLKRRHAQLAGSLSGGQQQMLSLARGLLCETKVLLVDEPTKGLAPKVVNEVVDVLMQVKEGSTMLLVEQNLSAAQRLADKVIVISDGQIAAAGSGEMLADRDELRRYLGVGRG